MGGGQRRFAGRRMRAAGIAPEAAAVVLFVCAPLQQDRAVAVDDEDAEGAVQHSFEVGFFFCGCVQPFVLAVYKNYFITEEHWSRWDVRMHIKYR